MKVLNIEVAEKMLSDAEFNTKNVYVIMLNEQVVGFCQIIRNKVSQPKLQGLLLTSRSTSSICTG